MQEQADLLCERINKHCEAGQWDEALVAERCLVDEHHCEHLMYQILPHVHLDFDLLQQENSASSWGLLGLAYYYSTQINNMSLGYACFCKAAEMGHVLALDYKGHCLYTGHGIPQDEAAGFRCMIAANTCGSQCSLFGIAYAYEHGHGAQQSYFRAASYYVELHDAHNVDRLLQGANGFECTPFGYWTPDLTLQQLVHPIVMDALRTTMVMCKRLSVDRHVARIIVAYVCTKGTQWDCLRDSDQ